MSSRLGRSVVIAGALAAIQAPLFRSDTHLVAVSVTVVEADGRLVRGLTASAFTASENDRPRPIVQFTSDPVPLSLVVAIDTSASMQGPRFERARQAAVRVIEALTPQDKVRLFGFNESPYRMVDWTSSRDAVVGALADV